MIAVVQPRGRLLTSAHERPRRYPLSAPFSQLIVAAVALAGGVLVVWPLWPWGLLALLPGLLLLAGYLRDGGVPTAFAAFRRGDIKGVRAALAHALWPTLMSARNRAYHDWMAGVVAAADCRFEAAHELLLRAAAGAIQTENDRSLIQCLLAEVALRRGDCPTAAAHLQLARRLEHPPQVERMIERIDERRRAVAAGAEPSG